MCVDMCADMSTDMRVDMYLYMCLDVCVDYDQYVMKSFFAVWYCLTISLCLAAPRYDTVRFRPVW